MQILQRADPQRRLVRMGRRRPDRAEEDIIGAIVQGLASLVSSVSGSSHQLSIPQQVTSGGNGETPGGQVDSGAVHDSRDVDPVVDEHGSTSAGLPELI